MKPKIYFCRLTKDVLGDSQYPSGVIRIDLHKNRDYLYTFLHEMLHLEHPEWSEERVVRGTANAWKRLTAKQKFELGHILFKRYNRWCKDE